jgi:hypothetical protein
MDYWPFVQDPQAVLDYKWDWRALTNGSGDQDWLSAGEVITDYEVTASAGLSIDSHALTNGDTAVIMWISVSGSEKQYQTHCWIQTNQGRQDERTRILRVEQL